jgi:hypothetical protein
MALPLSLFRNFSVQDLLRDHATSKKADRESKSLSSSNLRPSTLADYGDGMGSAQRDHGKVGTFPRSSFSFFPLPMLGGVWARSFSFTSIEVHHNQATIPI